MFTPEEIAQQIPFCLGATDFPTLGEKYEGKVRDNYIKDGRRVLIATDRLSAFDRVITLIPFKGQVLNQIAEFWFRKTSDIVKNHVIAFPDPNVVVARECLPLPVEMVVRGYLTGVTTTSAWYHYERGGRNFCGNVLPEGMRKNQQFSRPILTPSTKAAHGGHDESVAPEEIVGRGVLTREMWQKLADISLRLFARGVEICAEQGIILVDTKYEFGLLDGEIILMDEIHTPDSSRFWFANEYEARFSRGEEQKKIDKEYLREWLAARGFIGEGEIPAIPDEIRVETARRYIEAYELITGREFEAEVGEVISRIQRNVVGLSS
ncbi:phosphoribosylaminoimidazolesuccinocarboxamide synthase [Candidatus Peregrinibacteria bacterium]|nr:phosphoribosylaminoimidazolesuccinocarboxamide synthase [Candidatus Peregrinibacteria bacterium]